MGPIGPGLVSELDPLTKNLEQNSESEGWAPSTDSSSSEGKKKTENILASNNILLNY